MAFSAHKEDALMEELRESPEEVDSKAAQLADMIKQAKRAIVFTGAGVSTSTGIPDFRGPEGIWTLKAKGDEQVLSARLATSTAMTKAVPSRTHMVLQAMLSKGLICHIISQNIDGLHRKSGVKKEQLSELHGNSNLEICRKCHCEYLRDFEVKGGPTHETGRRCTACGGALYDTIIHFNEQLPIMDLDTAFSHAASAHLHIVLGSSLTVRPACDMPKETHNRGGKVVIVNLQRTPLDDIADLRIHAESDALLDRVATLLGLSVPAWSIERSAAVWRGTGGSIHCAGLSSDDGTPVTFFRRCHFEAGGKSETVDGEGEVILTAWKGHGQEAAGRAVVRCEFFGHYGEPQVELELPDGKDLQHFGLSFQPGTEAWVITARDDTQVPTVHDLVRGPHGGGNIDKTQIVFDAGAAEAAPDYGLWFSVQPLPDCPHTTDGVKPSGDVVLDLKGPCASCGNVGENMLCLFCHQVHCGRYAKEHMLQHNAATGHPIVCGFLDLSFWCYACENYIDPSNKNLRPYYDALHTAKFGAPPFRPQRAAAEPGSSSSAGGR